MYRPVQIPLKFGPKFNVVDYHGYLLGSLFYCYLEAVPTENLVNGDVILSGLPPVHGIIAYMSLPTASGNSYTAAVTNGVLKAYFNSYTEKSRIDAVVSYISLATNNT